MEKRIRKWKKEKSWDVYLLLTNACIDEVEAFLNLFADWRWRGNVISGRVKASLVGRIMDGDQLPFGTRVWEASLLDQCFSLFLAFAYFLNVTALLSDNIVSRFIAMNNLFTSDFKSHSFGLHLLLRCIPVVIVSCWNRAFTYKYIFKSLFYYTVRKQITNIHT